MRDKVREWAAHNALTLIFLSFMFFLTWIVIVVDNYVVRR